MEIIDPASIPIEVIQAADLVARYFEERNIKGWALAGVRDRWYWTPSAAMGSTLVYLGDTNDTKPRES